MVVYVFNTITALLSDFVFILAHETQCGVPTGTKQPVHTHYISEFVFMSCNNCIALWIQRFNCLQWNLPPPFSPSLRGSSIFKVCFCMETVLFMQSVCALISSHSEVLYFHQSSSLIMLLCTFWIHDEWFKKKKEKKKRH